MNFQKLFDQNPQNDFFRVWTSFMLVDKDLWKSKLFLQNTSLTKCYICEWIFKSYLIKIHKVTSLEYEPVLCVLIKNFDSYSCFFQTQQWQNVILLHAFSKIVIKIHKLTSLEYEPVLWVLIKIFDSYSCFF